VTENKRANCQRKQVIDILIRRKILLWLQRVQLLLLQQLNPNFSGGFVVDLL